METLSISEAKSRFSELISRAGAGERFLIRRRSRPVAVLVGSTELARLERLSETAYRLAVVLGQDTDLLEQIEAGHAHPAMAAFGLWREAKELSTLADEVDAEREGQPSRAEVAL